MDATQDAPFGTLAARLVDGVDPEQVARDLVEALTPEQRVDLMWGDADFWSGLAEMLAGGYNRRPYVAGAVPDLCHARAPGSAVERPPRWLVAFAKVRLEPGTSEQVALDIPVDRLAHYDEAVHDFIVEPTAYELLVGRHSLDPDSVVAEILVSA